MAALELLLSAPILLSLALRSSGSIFGRIHDRASQLGLVRRAAALLTPNLRGKFLRSIAHELADVDPIDDEAVQGAVDAIIDAAAR